MTEGSITSAVISTDDGFRQRAKAVLHSPGRRLTLGAELASPFEQIRGDVLRRLRDAAPMIVLLDLEPDPRRGVRLARFLAEAEPMRQLIAAGPAPTPEQLMAAMRAGIAEYLAKPLDEQELAATVDRLAQRLRSGDDGASDVRSGRIHALLGAAGGAGCTTLATNLAIELHRLTGTSTVLVDLDFELGDADVLLGLDPEFSIQDAIRNFHRLDAPLMTSFLARHESGIRLLAAPYDPIGADAIGAADVHRVLAFLARHYEHVVVDGSRSLSPRTLAALEAADRAYLVTIAELAALRNVKRWLPRLRAGPRERDDGVRLIVNRHTAAGAISAEDIRRAVGRDVYGTVPDDAPAVGRSANTGEPVVTSGPSPFADEVKRLAGAITDTRIGHAAPDGLLARTLRFVRSTSSRIRAGPPQEDAPDG